jgi:hypothetical protein
MPDQKGIESAVRRQARKIHTKRIDRVFQNVRILFVT